MGAGASSLARAELQKPLDASDVGTLASAKDEVVRLRRLLAEHSRSPAGASPPLAAQGSYRQAKRAGLSLDVADDRQRLVQATAGAADMIRAIRSGEQTCVAVVDACLRRIEDVNKICVSCVEVLAESARARAAEVDAKVAAGAELGALEGLPIVVKCNIDVAGTLTTAGTPALADAGWRPASTAPCAQSLLDAGAIVLAKTNMPEGALRADGWSTAHGMCRNPHSLYFTPGGSSSGTGSAIASGMVPCGLGTDTGGSTRLPAACNGVCGFRPSKGRWPAGGVVPLDELKDTVGPMGSCVADLALLDSVVVSGPGPAAATAAAGTDEAPGGEASGDGGDLVPVPARLEGTKVLVATELMDGYDKLAPTCREGAAAAAATLEKAGCDVVRASDFIDKVVKVAPKIGAKTNAFADLQAYLDRHADRPDSMQTAAAVRAEMKQEAVRYAFTPAEDPGALAAQLADLESETAAANQAWDDFFAAQGIDAILVPTLGTEPFSVAWLEESTCQKLGEFAGLSHFTVLFNHLQVPSVALPVPTVRCAASRIASVPASVMLWGKRNGDRELLALALALEKAMAIPGP